MMFKKKKTIVPLRLLKIDEEGYHLSVNVAINGKDDAILIIDPGASRTVFDEKQIKRYLNIEKAKKINRKTIGVGKEQIQAKRIEIKTLEIGDLVVKNYNAAAVDLSGINKQYKRLHFDTVQGLLGGDLLEEYKATINYKKLELTLHL